METERELKRNKHYYSNIFLTVGIFLFGIAWILSLIEYFHNVNGRAFEIIAVFGEHTELDTELWENTLRWDRVADLVITGSVFASLMWYAACGKEEEKRQFLGSLCLWTLTARLLYGCLRTLSFLIQSIRTVAGLGAFSDSNRIAHQESFWVIVALVVFGVVQGYLLWKGIRFFGAYKKSQTEEPSLTFILVLLAAGLVAVYLKQHLSTQMLCVGLGLLAFFAHCTCSKNKGTSLGAFLNGNGHRITLVCSILMAVAVFFPMVRVVSEYRELLCEKGYVAYIDVSAYEAVKEELACEASSLPTYIEYLFLCGIGLLISIPCSIARSMKFTLMGMALAATGMVLAASEMFDVLRESGVDYESIFQKGFGNTLFVGAAIVGIVVCVAQWLLSRGKTGEADVR